MMGTCIPVLHDGRVIAVVTRESNLSSPRFSLGFDSWTAQVSDNLCQMISRGEYPYDTTPAVTARGVPRVLDGVILIDPDGKVLETTPNATRVCDASVSATQCEERSAQEITNVIADESMIEESMAVVVMGRASWRTEISSHASTITMRALPSRKAVRASWSRL